MYIISSCLVGVNCRYNGGSFFDKGLLSLVKAGEAIILCPEILSGLYTPRTPCEIITDEKGLKKVLDKQGKDCTQIFLDGAQKTLDICKIASVDTAILKNNSPSCGFGKIYDGTFEGKLIAGNGITAQLLYENGIRVLNDENWREELGD